MKFHEAIVRLVAAACLILHTGVAKSFNLSELSRETRATRFPFVIYVPDNPPGTYVPQQSETSPEELETTNNRGITVVEIVRSVEVKLNGSNELNGEIVSSDTGDLLFSDIDNKNNLEQISRQSTDRHKHNSRVRYRRIKGSDILPVKSVDTNDENTESGWKTASGRVSGNNLSPDGLDFSSRILLGNVLVRKSNNEIEDGKYTHFTEPKASDNKYHATYINHNSSIAFNKSRINVKFPPKIFPLKNINSQQNRPNKTSSVSNKISQSQKALYRSRIGKQPNITLKNIQNTANENKQNPSEDTSTNIPQTQDRKERLQALTHWDFGKKTPDTPIDEDSYAPISGTSSTATSVNHISSDLVTDLPHLVHPTRDTLQPPEVTTTKAVTENVIKQPVRAQGILQNSFPKHQRFPTYSNINSIKTLPVYPTVNSKSARPYQVIHTHNGNVIWQNLGPHMFPNTQVQDYRNDVTSENFDDSNTRTYSSQTTAQNYIPVANIVQQSEQQHGVRNNLRPVYFVPHVAPQQHQHFPAVVSLRPVDTGGATAIPVLIQQQNSAHLYEAVAVDPTPTLALRDGVVYEGKPELSSVM
jgi:hypothetical protein